MVMSTKVLRGEPVAPGRAAGPLAVLCSTWGDGPPRPGEARSPASEIERFQQQVSVLAKDIERAVSLLEAESLAAEAEIMRAHLVMLRDPEFHRQVHALVQGTRYAAEVAVEHVLEDMAEMLRSSENPVLAERACDLKDLAMRIRAKLCPERTDELAVVLGETKGAVVAIPELLPSRVLEARALGVIGFIVEKGTAVSHGAILAKSFGMPAVRVASLEVIRPFADERVLVDADAGEILVRPTEDMIAARSPPREKVAREAVPGAPQARVWLSIVEPAQLEAVDWTGIEGVGLYRTEALFMQHRERFPSEPEQLDAYRELFRLAGGRPVVVRVADLGADKPVEHMSFGPQDNPYLGLRAHRIFRFHPEILITQARAVLRAAHGGHQLRLMFPMLETVDQWQLMQQLVQQAVDSLARERLPFQRDFLQGVLIETPSAAWGFNRFLRVIDFASVGTNDLVQYLFAVERNAANVADLYLPEHPVVLEVLQRLAEQAKEAGKALSICGEIAADPFMLPLLVGVGLRDFSVAPGAVGAVAARLRTLNETECQRLAQQCLQADTAAEVRSLIGRWPVDSRRVTPADAGQAVDPACGMVVQTRDNPYSLRVDAVTHYFCSRGCMRRFLSMHRPLTQ